MNSTEQPAVGAPVEPTVRPDHVREAFEAWYSNDGKWPAAVERSDFGPSYKLGAAEHAWTAWQAAAAHEKERCARLCDPTNADKPEDWTEYAKVRAECAGRIRGA